MTDLITDIRSKFKNSNIAVQFIFVNIAVFLITQLISLSFYLFNIDFSFIKLNLSLPATLPQILLRPWSLLTYMFMHDGWLHIFFNMLLLYWFGQFFLNYYSAKHLRGLYFLGGIIGGLFFILAYAIFPVLKLAAPSSSLIGASAAVLAIVIAISTRIPNESVRLLLVGSIKLKYLAFFVILTDLLMILNENPGGHIAHLGGAFAGFCFARCLVKGYDLTHWINTVLDFPIRIRKAIISKRKEKRMKVSFKNKSTKRTQDYSYNASKKASEAEIDAILDKIKESGYNNLTEKEKRKLFDAGK